MKPNVFLLHALLLGLFITAATAQTRLDTSQVAPLQGDVQGAFASTTLRDANSANDHGNGRTNSIAHAIVDCGRSVSCSIIIPPSYATGEAVPGYQFNYATPPPPTTTPGNVAIIDRRYSDARMLVNNLGYTISFINTPSGWVYDYYSKAAANANLASMFLRQWSIDGGTNQTNAALNYSDKTTWATVLANGISHSPGQHVNLGLGGQATSLGDYTAIHNQVNCNGGYVTEGDLGCRAIDNIVAQGNVEYSGALTGTPTTGASSLTVSPVQGKSTQGAGRFLARTSAGVITVGTISQLSNNYNAPATVTGLGTAWPVSIAVAQLGVDINTPGVAVVTPSSFSVGAMSAIRTNSLVCVADPESFEMLYPSAVTATTFTASFAKPHSSNASVSAGGLCGYLLDLTADDVTDATFPNKTQTIAGTLHFAWPVIASTSTTATVWLSGDGNWQQMVSRWNAASANGYKLYPFAEVTSTQKAGGLSDTLAVGPNSVAWTANDAVSEFLYPAGHFLFGNSVVESYYPNMASSNGYSLKYNMPLQGADAMLSLVNNAPTSFYASKGGQYGSPAALHVRGPIVQGFTADLPADKATIGFGCSTPCTASENLIAAANASYYDFLFYDTANKRLSMSTNSNSTRYTFGSAQFALPFANVAIASDSSSNGYIAAVQLRSTLATNSDASGELVYANTTTATQALQGTYANHPECSARTDFDAGAANRYWIAYGVNSFTVVFAAPVTGVVTYSCAARN